MRCRPSVTGTRCPKLCCSCTWLDRLSRHGVTWERNTKHSCFRYTMSHKSNKHFLDFTHTRFCVTLSCFCVTDSYFLCHIFVLLCHRRILLCHRFFPLSGICHSVVHFVSRFLAFCVTLSCLLCHAFLFPVTHSHYTGWYFLSHSCLCRTFLLLCHPSRLLCHAFLLLCHAFLFPYHAFCSCHLVLLCHASLLLCHTFLLFCHAFLFLCHAFLLICHASLQESQELILKCQQQERKVSSWNRQVDTGDEVSPSEVPPAPLLLYRSSSVLVFKAAPFKPISGEKVCSCLLPLEPNPFCTALPELCLLDNNKIVTKYYRLYYKYKQRFC